MTAIGCDLETNATGPRPVLLEWKNDLSLPDRTGEYEVRINSLALTEMRTEARRGNRVRSPQVETGGMLLGSFDEATQTVLIDTAVGPSPDSHLSAAYFDHGTEGTQQVVEVSRSNSANNVGFVGMWHTHPYGLASPSSTDEAGMSRIVAPDGKSRRSLMLILAGGASVWRDWLDHGTPPDVYARVVDRASARGSEGPGEENLTSTGVWYPGGYAYPTRSTSHHGGRKSIGTDK